MPSMMARAFIRPTKRCRPPGKVRPSACAARFSLDIRARCISSPRVSVVPTARRERLPFSVSMSSSVMVIISSSGRRASDTISPVISLVSEAMGSTAWSFLLNSTSCESWSITSATLDFSSSGSSTARRPAIWPNDRRAGRTSCGAWAATGRSDRRVSWAATRVARSSARLLLAATVRCTRSLPRATCCLPPWRWATLRWPDFCPRGPALAVVASALPPLPLAAAWRAGASFLPRASALVVFWAAALGAAAAAADLALADARVSAALAGFLAGAAVAGTSTARLSTRPAEARPTPRHQGANRCLSAPRIAFPQTRTTNGEQVY